MRCPVRVVIGHLDTLAAARHWVRERLMPGPEHGFGCLVVGDVVVQYVVYSICEWVSE